VARDESSGASTEGPSAPENRLASDMAATPDGSNDGFRIVNAVLALSETADLLRTLEASPLTRSRAGARHLMKHPAVSDVANDPRLLAIASGFLGPSAVSFRATLFDKSSARNWLVPWHQDTALPLQERRDVPGWGPWSIKAEITYAHAPATALSHVVALRLHFDDSREDNGPLRVLPATHAFGVLSEADTERLVREIPPVDCLVSSGGIIAMRPLILHASSKAETDHPRRVLHIEYVDSLEIDDGLRIAIA
jgi:ectoine hydroxylase-related dioxygenase (phytanoyl-CoA dioxygenase family)